MTMVCLYTYSPLWGTCVQISDIHQIKSVQTRQLHPYHFIRIFKDFLSMSLFIDDLETGAKVRIFAFLRHIDLFGCGQALHTVENISLHTSIHVLRMVKFLGQYGHSRRIGRPLNIPET